MVPLQLDEHAHYSVVTLNRPEVGNALNDEMIQGLTQVFKNPPQSSRFIVLKSAGKHFCAGADLNRMRQSSQFSYEENLADTKQLSACFKAIYDCPLPVLAYAQGAVYGGGLGLLACADYVAVSPHTSLCFSEIKLGIIPALISPYVFQKIGISHSMALMLSANVFDAEHALQIGLIHEISHETDMAEKFLKLAPNALLELKNLLRSYTTLQIDSALIAKTTTILASIRTSPEGQEGFQAFFEKRQPNWLKG